MTAEAEGAAVAVVEAAADDKLSYKKGHSPKVRSDMFLQRHVTERCNVRCTYRYQGDPGKNLEM